MTDTRALVRTIAAAPITALVATVQRDELAQAITAYEEALVPLKSAEARLDGPLAQSVKTALAPIGAKLAPHLSRDQASAWADAIMLSLSKWPAKTARSAIGRAVTEPFKFLGDVDARLHAIAAEIDEVHRLTLAKMRRLREEIERAANPTQPQLAPPDDSPITQEQVNALSPHFRKLGLTAGYITQAQFDAAKCDEPSLPEPASMAHRDSTGEQADRITGE